MCLADGKLDRVSTNRIAHLYGLLLSMLCVCNLRTLDDGGVVFLQMALRHLVEYQILTLKYSFEGSGKFILILMIKSGSPPNLHIPKDSNKPRFSLPLAQGVTCDILHS